MQDPRDRGADVPVLIEVAGEFQQLGNWKEGTEVAKVLSDIQQKLCLFPEEGKLVCTEKAGLSDDVLRLGPQISYVFFPPPGECSAYDLCNMALPSQHDLVSTKGSTGGVMMVKTDEDTSLREKLQQWQHQLARQPCVFMQPQLRKPFKIARCEDGLVEALARVVFDPVNDMIDRLSRGSQRSYAAYWSRVHRSIPLSPSSRRGSSSRRNSGSGSMSSSRTTSHGQVRLDAAAALEEEAASAAVAPDVGDNLPAAAYRVCMDPFSSGLGVDALQRALRDRAKQLTAHTPVPRESLSPDFHFCASPQGWHQEQQLLRATCVSGGTSSRSFVAGHLSTAARLAQTAAATAAPAEGAASFPLVASLASSSVAVVAATAAATSAAAVSESSEQEEGILVTGEVQPASVMCQAFNMKTEEFLQCVAACSSEQHRISFSLAARCKEHDKVALAVVSQASGHAFFAGTRLFMITCYSVLWVGQLEQVEEKLEDGNIGLEATVTLSEPIFGKDAGPENATARAAYLWLADQSLAHPYLIRQIAKPDVLVAPNAEVAVSQQGGRGDDGNDTHRNHVQQQQHMQVQMPMLPQQPQQPQQPLPQRQQQPLSSSHRSSVLDKRPMLEYQHFRFQHLQLHSLISDGETAQVFCGSFLGQEAVIKTLSLHWKPAGSYIHEAIMYGLLHDLQLSGVLCRLLGHGEYYGMRYCMVFAPATGSPLSQLPEPFSVSVQQAVLAAVADIHHHDVIHDDLHKDNIYVHLAPGAPPKVTVIDLGRARPVDGAREKEEEIVELQKMLRR